MSVIDKIKLDGTTYDVGKTPDTTLAVSGSPADAATVGTELDKKVDKVTGKGLSTEDFTTAEKTKLAGIAEGATNIVIDPTLTQSGQAADAAAVGKEITELKEDLERIATFEQAQDEIIYHNADLQSTYNSTYVNEGSIDSFGNFSASASYRTYYLEATEDMNAWLKPEPSSENMYLCIAVYNGTISRASFVARYRNIDGNLPTQTNKLAIVAGQWIAISHGYSSIIDRDFNLYTGLYISVSTDPTPTAAFMSAINEQIELPSAYTGKVTKTATSLTVYIDKLKYEINKYSNSTIRAYLWRTNACRVLDSNNVYQTVWENSDSDGVVKISGESDFIGGYHGDETETLFHLFIDGVEYAENSTFTDLSFNEIILYFESDVYHCVNSSTPDVVAFKRNKIIKFNNNGYTVENYWTAQEDLTCEISYIGMLSVENALINAYHTNGDFKYHMLDSGIARSSDITDVCFSTPYGDIGMKISEQIPANHYGCCVSAYTGRLKVYASNFSSSAHGALTNGDVLKGKSVTYFRG